MRAAREPQLIASKTVPLGEIAEIKLGKMLDRAKHTTGRKLPYLRNVNVRWGTIETDDLLEMHFKDDELDRFGLQPNDVVVCEGGEPGRAAVWTGGPTELKFQKALHRVRFKVPYEPRFLVYLLELLAKSGGLERRFTGSTIKHFTREAFLGMPVPLLPEQEQRRIVEEIEKQFTRLDAGVKTLMRAKANLARYRAAVLKAACEGQLVGVDATETGDARDDSESGQELLQRVLKNAEDVKGGAGQYFTPRALIAAMVDVVAPRPGETICDPACGTGGFLLGAYNYLADPKHYKLDKAQKKRLKQGTFFGIELVDSVARLCAMNLLLHGIGGDSENDLPVATRDALAGKHGEYDIVLANPPFGKKSSVTIVNDAGETSKESLVINRDDFWASTSNKQLNFVQHIFTILKQHGRAAVVVPDNVLFEGGAGETVRRALLAQADVHTLLRLPTGIFYAQGVKANVLFFDRKPAEDRKAWTEKLWIYDLRTNQHFTLKENPLKRSDLDDFVRCYHTKNRHDRSESERFRSFTYDELVKRDKVSLDIFWLKDESLEESANLPAPEVIAQDIADDLQAALEQFAAIAEDLR